MLCTKIQSLSRTKQLRTANAVNNPYIILIRNFIKFYAWIINGYRIFLMGLFFSYKYTYIITVSRSKHQQFITHSTPAIISIKENKKKKQMHFTPINNLNIEAHSHAYRMDPFVLAPNTRRYKKQTWARSSTRKLLLSRDVCARAADSVIRYRKSAHLVKETDWKEKEKCVGTVPVKSNVSSLWLYFLLHPKFKYFCSIGIHR